MTDLDQGVKDSVDFFCALRGLHVYGLIPVKGEQVVLTYDPGKTKSILPTVHALKQENIMSQSIFTNEASKQHGQFKQGVDGWEHTEYLFVSSHHKNRACVEVLTEWLTLIINSLAVLSRLLFFSTFLNTSSFC